MDRVRLVVNRVMWFLWIILIRLSLVSVLGLFSVCRCCGFSLMVMVLKWLLLMVFFMVLMLVCEMWVVFSRV